MPDEELLQAIDEQDKYLDELLQAVVWEIEDRKLSHRNLQTLQDHLKDVKVSLPLLQEQMNPNPNTEIKEQQVVFPPLFSQTAILAFALFFSPLAGGILLAINVFNVYKKGVLPVVIFSILYTLLQGYTFLQIPDAQKGNLILMVIPVAGALILSDVLWNRYIGKKVQYEKRSILVPLLIALVIFLPLYYITYQYPELMPFLNGEK